MATKEESSVQEESSDKEENSDTLKEYVIAQQTLEQDIDDLLDENPVTELSSVEDADTIILNIVTLLCVVLCSLANNALTWTASSFE